MDYSLPEIAQLITGDRALALLRAAILLVAGFAVARFASSALARTVGKSLSTHHAMLMRRGIYYLVLVLFAVMVLRELGFSLSVLLGAAGVFSVAIGFAAQTSMSNLISGLFLLGERPFRVSDIIKVGDTTGEVVSIDLMSVNVRTFDNLSVRIPNEQMIKSEVTTLTKYPIRRYDMQVGVAYKEDIGRVREVLMDVADRNPLCLDEPAPLIIFQGYGDSSVNLQFSVWARRENYLDLRNGIAEEVKASFDAMGIEIPFPHRTLYTGSVTEPFPVRIMGNAPGGTSRATAGDTQNDSIDSDTRQ
jgi:small-conductance mechanosensitive channel